MPGLGARKRARKVARLAARPAAACERRCLEVGRREEGVAVVCVVQIREVPVNALGRTMSVFTQTQEQPATTRKEWSPSAVMDIQIYHLCRTLHFLVVRVGDPVFAHAIRDDSSVRLLNVQSDMFGTGERNCLTGRLFQLKGCCSA